MHILSLKILTWKDNKTECLFSLETVEEASFGEKWGCSFPYRER